MNELEIPIELLNLVLGLIASGATWLVVAGIKGVVDVFGWKMPKWSKTVAAVISAGVVGVTVNLIDLAVIAVPASAVPAVQSGLGFLVILLAAMGIQRQSKK